MRTGVKIPRGNIGPLQLTSLQFLDLKWMARALLVCNFNLPGNVLAAKTIDFTSTLRVVRVLAMGIECNAHSSPFNYPPPNDDYYLRQARVLLTHGWHSVSKCCSFCYSPPSTVRRRVGEIIKRLLRESHLQVWKLISSHNFLSRILVINFLYAKTK